MVTVITDPAAQRLRLQSGRAGTALPRSAITARAALGWAPGIEIGIYSILYRSHGNRQ